MLKLCHHRQVFFSLILLLAVGVFAPGVASAQDATIAGTVADTTGGILPGVTVDARDAAGRSQVTVTDGTGQFTFSGLAPGTYAVTFTLSGFTAPAQVGVVARIVTGPHDAHRQDPHLPMRYDTGRPRAVIRLRISQPRTTSLPCPAGLRARRPSPMMDVSRKNAFSTRL